MKRILLGALLGPIALMLFACDADTLNHLPGVDPWLDGNPTEFAAFALAADEGPVVMINLLKFRERSADGNGTGAEAYARYAELAGPFVERHGGSLAEDENYERIAHHRTNGLERTMLIALNQGSMQ